MHKKNLFKKILYTFSLCFLLYSGPVIKASDDFADFNFDDIDIVSLEVNTTENEKSLKEQLSILLKAMDGMTLKEKGSFIYDIMKCKMGNAKGAASKHIKNHQKKYIVSLALVGTTTLIVLGKIFHDRKQKQ